MSITISAKKRNKVCHNSEEDEVKLGEIANKRESDMGKNLSA